MRKGQPADDLLGSLRRPPLPEGAPVTEALAAFKRVGLPLAFVVDELGHIEGFVTSTDVLEEPLQAPVVRCGDGPWLVDGLCWPPKSSKNVSGCADYPTGGCTSAPEHA